MKSRMQRFTRGFTLIELIVVIAIVAVLAAVALPRFIDTQSEARTAKAKAIFGSIRSAAALAKARCELDQMSGMSLPNCKTDGSGGASVQMEGVPVYMVYGYPAATAAGIGAAAQINAAADGLTLNTPSGAGIHFDIDGGTPTRCSIYYAPATLAATGAQVAPQMSVDTSGC